MRTTKIYPEDRLREAISKSISLAETLKNLGLVPAGGNYLCLKKYIKIYDIDTSHFLGQGYLRGKTHTYGTRPLGQILIYGNLENTHRLRIRLIREGIKKHECEKCNLKEWQNKPIPLEVHHKDGDRYNNTLENLQLLCPNCHALTDNYRGKNQERVKYPDPKKLKSLPVFKPKVKPPKIPKEPYQHPTKRPSKEILEVLIWEKPTVHISKEYSQIVTKL
jgi:hypothetical protein